MRRVREMAKYPRLLKSETTPKSWINTNRCYIQLKCRTDNKFHRDPPAWLQHLDSLHADLSSFPMYCIIITFKYIHNFEGGTLFIVVRFPLSRSITIVWFCHFFGKRSTAVHGCLFSPSSDAPSCFLIIFQVLFSLVQVQYCKYFVRDASFFFGKQ